MNETFPAPGRQRRRSTARRPELARLLQATHAAILAAGSHCGAGESACGRAVIARLSDPRGAAPIGQATADAADETDRSAILGQILQCAHPRAQWVAPDFNTRRPCCRKVMAAYDAAFTSYETGPDRVSLPITETVDAISRSGISGQDLLVAVAKFEAGRHIGLVQQQANKLAKTYPAYSPEDLFGWGWRGLVVALQRYDPTDYTLATYAVSRIVGNIQDGARSESPVPKRLASFSRSAERTAAELAQEHGQAPTDAQIANRLALTELTKELGETPSLEDLEARQERQLEKLAILPRLRTPAELSEINEPRSRYEDPATAVIGAIEGDGAIEALSELPQDLAQAVYLLDYLGLSTTDAAKRTGFSARQLRMRRKKGIDILREKLGVEAVTGVPA